MTIDELKRALECHAADRICSTCPFVSSAHCSENMARAALDALNTKAEPFDQRQMALKTVEKALDKGGYSVTVTPDGEVRMMPWGETARLIKDDTQNGIWRCSACGKKYGWVSKTFKFCPKCGAAMEVEDDDP